MLTDWDLTLRIHGVQLDLNRRTICQIVFLPVKAPLGINKVLYISVGFLVRDWLL